MEVLCLIFGILLSRVKLSGSGLLPDCSDCQSPNVCINDKCFPSKKLGQDCDFDLQCQFQDKFSICSSQTREVPGSGVGRFKKTETYHECTCYGDVSLVNQTCFPKVYDSGSKGIAFFVVAVIVVILVGSLVFYLYSKKKFREWMSNIYTLCFEFKCGEVCDRMTRSHRKRMRGKKVHAVTKQGSIVEGTSQTVPSFTKQRTDNNADTRRGSQPTIIYYGAPNITVYVNTLLTQSVPTVDAPPAYAHLINIIPTKTPK